MSQREIKILHCADFHIGAEISSLGELALQRKSELFFAFEKIINLCRDEKVDFLCIAGDLFDHVHIESHVVNETIELIKSIPDTIVVISPGNHDPFCIDSCYYTKSWPSNVVLFQEELSYVVFKDRGVCLWGAGFKETYHMDSFFNYPSQIPDGDFIHLCVIHGDLIPKGSGSSYNPIFKEALNQYPFDYLALGHVHKRTPIQKEGKTYYAYSGTPEGRGFDELGELGVYIGNVSKGRCSLQFRRISKRCYMEVNIEIDNEKTPLNTSAAIAENIIAELKLKYPLDAKDNFYKIILSGDIPETLRIDIDAILLRLKEFCYYAKIEDQTAIIIDYDSFSKDQTLKGIFVRKMIEKINEAKNKNNKYNITLFENALKVGIKAFDSEVVLRDYK